VGRHPRSVWAGTTGGPSTHTVRRAIDGRAAPRVGVPSTGATGSTAEPRPRRGKVRAVGWEQLHRIGGRQHGAVSERCAEVAGLAPSSLRTRAVREGWQLLGPSVWLLPGAPRTLHARASGAVLAFPDGVVTRWSAAALHGLRRSAPTRLELLRPWNTSDVRTASLVTGRTRHLVDEDVVDVEGIAVTSLARTLRELARDHSAEALRDLGIDARVRDRAVFGQLGDLVARDRRFPGRPALRTLLAELGDDGSDSGFERRTLQRLVLRGLEPDAQQLPVVTTDGVRHLDLAWTDAAVGLECLGFAYHSSVEQLRRDVRRDNAITATGRWSVLRLTWEMFHREWDAFEQLLRSCLDRPATR
jgi:hypothetical protein